MPRVTSNMSCFAVGQIIRAARHMRSAVPAVCRRRWVLSLLVATLFFLFLLIHALKNLQQRLVEDFQEPQIMIGGEAILHYKCNGKLDSYDDPDEQSFIAEGEEDSQIELKSTRRLPSVCLDEECRAAYVKHFHRKDAYPIPPIRHILWRNESVSKYFAAQLQSWQQVHPDWTYVLWRDSDMTPLVATHFPGLLAKFKALPAQIMRVDMIRYLLLFTYGGVYADLDYSLVRGLDTYRRFQAVVTREPDAHALQFRSLTWPVKPLANPAFLMSAPGHPFLLYIIEQLLNSNSADVLNFAGPFGLTCMMENYHRIFPVAIHPAATVYVPPSHSFYPYRDNRLNNSHSDTVEYRYTLLTMRCQALLAGMSRDMRRAGRYYQLKQYCKDVNNMDPITDRWQPVFAVHDLQKAGGIWYRSTAGHSFYTTNMIDIQLVLKNVTFGRDFILKTKFGS